MPDAPKIDPDFILGLPQSVLETIPGGTPPPGVQALSPHPASLRTQTIIIGSVFLAVAAVFFAIRIYVKTKVVRKITLDDYVCTAAFAFAIVQYAGIMLAQTQGAGGRHQWDSTVAQLISHPNCIANWMTTVFVTPALGLAKLTFLLQYYQLFWPLRWVRLACWSVGSVFEIFYLAVTVTMFVICSPWPGESWVYSLLSEHYRHANKTSIPTGTVGAVFDIFLLIVPIRAVSSLQLEPRKKVGLMLVFLTGALASVASIVGLAYRVINTYDLADAEWHVTSVWIWMQIELFLGIACSCMPCFSKLLSHTTGTSAAAMLTPRNIFGIFRPSQHSKLSDEAKASAYTSNSSNSGRSRRQEKSSNAGFRMNEISGGASSPDIHQRPLDDGHIHMVQEVSIYDELRPEAIERGIIDHRW